MIDQSLMILERGRLGVIACKKEVMNDGYVNMFTICVLRDGMTDIDMINR